MVLGVLFFKAYHGLLDGSGLSRFGFLEALDVRVKRMLRKEYADVQGHRMQLDGTDYGLGVHLSVSEHWEKPEMDFALRHVREGDTVIDVGANIGYHTLLLARKVGAAGHVYAFEPDASNCDILRNNVAANGYGNCTVVNKAVSDADGTGTMHLSEKSSTHHRFGGGGGGRRVHRIARDRVRLTGLLCGNEDQRILCKD